jgi:hypothetical protein
MGLGKLNPGCTCCTPPVICVDFNAENWDLSVDIDVHGYWTCGSGCNAALFPYSAIIPRFTGASTKVDLGCTGTQYDAWLIAEAECVGDNINMEIRQLHSTGLSTADSIVWRGSTPRSTFSFGTAYTLTGWSAGDANAYPCNHGFSFGSGAEPPGFAEARMTIN